MANSNSTRDVNDEIENSDNRRNDPQVVVTGKLKEGANSDIITFMVDLGIFEIFCIVTIPAQGTKFAPVYLKLRIKKNG